MVESRKDYRRHTLRIMLMIFLVSSSLIFLSISALSLYYIYNSGFSLSHYTFPKSFVLSTVVLLFSSVFFFKARESFEAADLQSVKRYLLIVIGIAVLFAFLQFFGWNQLIAYGVSDTDSAAKSLTSFIYILSGIHFIHLFAGLLFLSWMVHSVSKALKDEVNSVLFATEPYTKARLATLSLFWIYLEVVWGLQFILFYLGYW